MRTIPESSVGILGIITALATLAALFIAIYQSVLARRSLDAAKKSIDEDKRSRQLSMISKMSWVIEVQIRIERWLNDLEKLKKETAEATSKNDAAMLKAMVATIPTSPDKINMAVPHLVYENMPDALREIMMSGAQYYYNAISPAAYLWTQDKGANWSYAVSIHDRYDDSISALRDLKSLISEMVPDVLLGTPASINERDFLRR
jgi:hypothetical protein